MLTPAYTILGHSCPCLCPQPPQPPRAYTYNLTGIVVHLGSLNGGHYIAFVKGKQLVGDRPASWFKMNDSNASEVGRVHCTVHAY